MNQQPSVKIDRIIEQRHRRVEKILLQEKRLKELKYELIPLERELQQDLDKINDANICDRLQKISLKSLIDEIDCQLNLEEKLKPRFNRKELKIAVLGRARQGKSKLLQSITGLTSAEIPDGDRGDCTGVRSTIFHRPGIETYAEVFFHSERSFLDEVINPYYAKLRLGVTPTSIEEFASLPLPSLPEELVDSATYGAMYEHLKRYHEYINIDIERFLGLLRQAEHLEISRDHIREYVAQDSLTGERIYFNYIAVREVKIFCSFPNADVGKIAVIDMIGLGDTGIGDEERMIKILEEDVDVAMFVRKPNSCGDNWRDIDVRLYDTVARTAVKLPIELWSFMVINQTNASSKNGDNFNQCQDLATGLTSNNMKFFGETIANCADREETNQKILDPILDYLTSNITKLDDQYESEIEQSRNKLWEQVKNELKQARNIFGNSTNAYKEIESLYRRLFEKLWGNISFEYPKLLKILARESESQDSQFIQQIEDVFQKCKEDTGIPSIDEVEYQQFYKGQSYAVVYSYSLNKVRTRLSKHFLGLDDGLKQSIETTKSLVADVLLQQGHFERLTDARGSEFFKVIEELIPENLDSLKLGFQMISGFHLSFRGPIQSRIRANLDKLKPNLAPRLPEGHSAHHVVDNLQEVHEETIYKCETALEEFLYEPSRASYAMVDEFIDQILLAEEAKMEWEEFLREIREQIWPEEFNPIFEYDRLRQKWINSVEKALDICEF